MTNRVNLVAAAVLGIAVSAAPALAADGGAVTVYRGAQAETVRFDTGAGVTVVRGQPAARPAEAHEHRAEWRRVGRAVAGDTLWMVEASSGRIVACEVHPTTQVGERRIGCVERMLPVAFR